MSGTRQRARGGARTRDEVVRLKRALAEARRRIAALERLVGRDPLTGVLNRRGFEVELERALAFSRRYGTGAALAFFDIDRFKGINDRFGHAAGDLALVHVATALARNTRRSDIVARIGGDEFIVLLWTAGEADAAAKAERVREIIERQEAGRPDVAISVGVTVLRTEDTAETALTRADAAMYADKTRRNGLRRA